MSKLPHELDTGPPTEGGEIVRLDPQPLKHSIGFAGSPPHERTRKLIEHLIARIDKRTRMFPSDALFLRVLVDESPLHDLSKVSLILELPGKTLTAKSEAPEFEVSLKVAFAEIERQLEHHKAALRREHLWKRLARRQEIRRRKSDAPVPDEMKRESFFGLVSPYLDELGSFVSHEIASAEAAGDLAPGELNAQDVIDAALLQAYEEFAENPIKGDIRSWLVRLAIEQIEAAISRSNSERSRTVHIEEDVPETSPAEDEITDRLDLYQSDEELKLEDIIPDMKVPTPEQEIETKELRQCVQAALDTMPRDRRRLLILRYVQGLTVGELAKATGKAEPEIEDTLEQSRRQLRERLIEANCRL